VAAVVAAVDVAGGRGAAFLNQAADPLRGAAYTAFDGAPPGLGGRIRVRLAEAGPATRKVLFEWA
jgi:hypothetical protein